MITSKVDATVSHLQDAPSLRRMYPTKRKITFFESQKFEISLARHFFVEAFCTFILYSAASVD
jgi:hypothetical protein